MDIEQIIHRLKFLISPTRFTALMDRLKNDKTSEDVYESVYPLIRQHGKRVRLKKKNIYVDKKKKKFRLQSNLGIFLSKTYSDDDYDIKLKKTIERGLKLNLIDTKTIYSVWIDGNIYYLYGEKYGERESNKEVVNEWDEIDLENFGYKKYSFTLRCKPECESFVEFYKDEPIKFHIKFLEFLI